jgi:hypothetical protein
MEEGKVRHRGEVMSWQWARATDIIFMDNPDTGVEYRLG